MIYIIKNKIFLFQILFNKFKIIIVVVKILFINSLQYVFAKNKNIL